MNQAHIPGIKPGSAINEDALRKQEVFFMKELDIIHEEALKYNITMRVIGSLAFRIKCPDYKYMQYENGRYLTDIDFIAYSGDIARVSEMFEHMGWDENMSVLQMFGDKRRIFYHPSNGIHSDVFIDKLRFCHDIDFRGRLDIDTKTISLIDLLLEKLQIVEINKKDLVDTMMLLRQYEVSALGAGNDTIDGKYLSAICARDWGWYRTATMNLQKVADFSSEYLNKENSMDVKDKCHKLVKLIEEHPKSLKWKMRSKIGDSMKWYREVEEVDR